MEYLVMARSFEVCLRISAILVLMVTTCVVALDTQTKLLFSVIEKKASYRDVNALKILVYVTSAAAVYNFLQLLKYPASAFSGTNLIKGSYINFAWLCFLLDQIAVYIIFAVNSAAFQACMVAVTGVDAFQWMKSCDKFTRFCVQMGGALLCGYLASIIMAVMASVSAYRLFSMYSPNWFLRLK